MAFDKLKNKIKSAYHRLTDLATIDVEESTPEKINEFITYCKDKNLDVLVDEGVVTSPTPEYQILAPQPGYLTMELKTKESDNPKSITIKSRTYTASDINTVVNDFKTKTDSLLSKLVENNVKYTISEDMQIYLA